MLLPTSIFSSSGVDVNNGRRNMAYLYGLSDFFTTVFQDTDVLNLLLETSALKASDIYSRFLQMTSSLSLESIQTTMSVQIKLVFITQETDEIGISSYTIEDNTVVNAAFLANRPFLPTEVLEQGVDFQFYQTATGTTLYLARPISEYNFSQQITSDGYTKYAVWLADAVVDEQLISNYYGNLLGILPEPSSELFSNYIYGLYYLYYNGPTLNSIQKGANLALGIPLSRAATETVLDIRDYLDTNQTLIITDQNQYLLPPTVPATVTIGQTLTLGEAVAQIVQIEDWIENGVWWVNVGIPTSIISTLPTSQTNRLANTGTFYYQLMDQYLKHNTFLIKINVGAFQDDQYFGTMFEIIQNSKPAHSQPIYVWNVNVGIDQGSFNLDDSSLTITTPTTPVYAINSWAINTNRIN